MPLTDQQPSMIYDNLGLTKPSVCITSSAQPLHSTHCTHVCSAHISNHAMFLNSYRLNRYRDAVLPAWPPLSPPLSPCLAERVRQAVHPHVIHHHQLWLRQRVSQGLPAGEGGVGAAHC